MQRLQQNRNDRRGRTQAGFTLIELVVVILVISILAAFLLPAINNVRITGRNAQVTADIKNLEAAIANFKLKFGVEPPSSFVLYEAASGWGNTDALTRNSVAIIRQIWPSYDFTNQGDPTTNTTTGTDNPTAGNQARDFNLDGDETDVFRLNGAECLAFFLGGNGIINSVAANRVATGFSANPTNPFAIGGNRVGPFYEIDGARLSDVDNDNVPELLDPLPNQTMPYQYFSSYNGRGYQIFGPDGAFGTSAQQLDDEVIRISGTATMSSVYLQTDTTMPSSPTSFPTGTPWNQKSYQIISPGLDGGYGVGGLFTRAGTSAAGDGIAVRSGTGDTFRSRSPREQEADNITNFSGGPLTKFFTPAGW